MDFFSLIKEIIDVKLDTLLNLDQKRTQIEAIVMDYLFNLQEEDLPALKAVIRMARLP